jgi:hypothetical protein
MKPDRIDRLFLLDQPAFGHGFHGTAWQTFKLKWRKEYVSYLRNNRSTRSTMRDRFIDVASLTIESVKVALLIAGGLVMMVVFAGASNVVMFPVRDFWIAELIGVGIFYAMQVSRLRRYRGNVIWLSPLERRARAHMQTWSQNYLMGLAGIEFKVPARTSVVV